MALRAVWSIEYGSAESAQEAEEAEGIRVQDSRPEFQRTRAQIQETIQQQAGSTIGYAVLERAGAGSRRQKKRRVGPPLANAPLLYKD